MLSITANGGRGGNGQDGTNGTEGSQGEDATTYLLTHENCNYDLIAVVHNQEECLVKLVEKEATQEMRVLVVLEVKKEKLKF